MPIQALNTLAHGAFPGAGDEILGIVFLVLSGLAGFYLFRGKPGR